MFTITKFHSSTINFTKPIELGHSRTYLYEGQEVNPKL